MQKVTGTAEDLTGEDSTAGEDITAVGSIAAAERPGTRDSAVAVSTVDSTTIMVSMDTTTSTAASPFSSGDLWGPWPDYYYQEPPAYIEQGQSFWYYCPNPSGYYPYVKSCSEPWQHIPAQTARRTIEGILRRSYQSLVGTAQHTAKALRGHLFGGCMDILKGLEVGQERSFAVSSPTVPSRKDYELFQKTVDAIFEEIDNDRLDVVETIEESETGKQYIVFIKVRRLR